jgi:enamine deaminase RidA (YjgF/YER057c/UK114 family)
MSKILRRSFATGWLALLGTRGSLRAQTKKEKAMKQTRLSNPATIHQPNGYSHVAEIASGKVVYISGQVALNKDGQLVGKDDFAAQAQQVFANLGEALKSVGASFAEVVKLNYFCADRVDRGQMAAVRSTRDRYVNTQAPPVSTFVFVSSLVNPDWLIEVEAVAVVTE